MLCCARFIKKKLQKKVVFLWNDDGIVSHVFGAHTHIQTADEKILPNGTTYITDLGMCGCYESVLGHEIQDVVYSIRSSKTRKLEVENKNIIPHTLVI